MTNELSELDELALRAVRESVERGAWKDIPDLARALSVRGLELLQVDAEQQQKLVKVEAGDHIDAEGWSSDINEAWRLVLNANRPGSCVIYFAHEPDYATVKAFARAAGVPVNQVQAEQRT